MKRTSLLVGIALAGLFTVCEAQFKFINPEIGQKVFAQEMADSTGLTSEQKIEMIIKNKGQFGSGDQLRRFFFGDLKPIAVQPGGAGMVVNLYNKANDITFSYCATYDVVVAVKKGEVKAFSASEVK